MLRIFLVRKKGTSKEVEGASQRKWFLEKRKGWIICVKPGIVN